MGSHQKPVMPPDMQPMMPFDMSRFEGVSMVPPMFPFQVPPMGMPGLPIPPPPAPQPMGTDAADYQLEMAAMAEEMMQQGGYGQPPPAPQYPPQPQPPQAPPPQAPGVEKPDTRDAVDPYLAAEIASVVHTLTSSQLTHALSAFKIFLDKSPTSAKRLLVNNPQLVYALIHAQYVLGNADRSLLPLNTADQKLAQLNRKERLAASAGGEGVLDEESDVEGHTQAARGRRTVTMDSTEEAIDLVTPSAEQSRVEPSNSGVPSRRREGKSKDGGHGSKRAGNAQKNAEGRPAQHQASRPPPAEGPLENLPPAMLAPDYGAPIVPQHGAHLTVARPLQPPPPGMPLPPAQPMQPMPPAPPAQPMQPSAAAARPMATTIEELMMEVQPAPPILVEEVLKNTEILTKYVSTRVTLQPLQHSARHAGGDAVLAR
ncbi:cleavage stimulation factor subunit 2 [Babesia caballi]|uniref:Cleavage stimulation factor subunit 2 n=1 Tax=Babesia caballi TaxID=5871 RepID=A0AAV4LWD0_BABCB|nr:cleavage stimulation factor subunit 2 [Babesia caballi]